MSDIIERLYNLAQRGTNNGADEATALEAAAEIKRLRERFEEISSPFDAIYLDDRDPDLIDQAAVATLEQFAQIRDLSETIQFADDCTAGDKT